MYIYIYIYNNLSNKIIIPSPASHPRKSHSENFHLMTRCSPAPGEQRQSRTFARTLHQKLHRMTGFSRPNYRYLSIE